MLAPSSPRPGGVEHATGNGHRLARFAGIGQPHATDRSVLAQDLAPSPGCIARGQAPVMEHLPQQAEGRALARGEGFGFQQRRQGRADISALQVGLAQASPAFGRIRPSPGGELADAQRPVVATETLKSPGHPLEEALLVESVQGCRVGRLAGGHPGSVALQSGLQPLAFEDRHDLASARDRHHARFGVQPVIPGQVAIVAGPGQHALLSRFTPQHPHGVDRRVHAAQVALGGDDVPAVHPTPVDVARHARGRAA